MRTLCLALWLFAGALAASAAASVSLAWDPSPDSDVVDYVLYVGNAPGTYTNSTHLGNVTNAVYTMLKPGAQYFFVVTAVNAGGAESDPSNEIDWTVPVTPPGRLRLTQTLQTASTPLGPWQEIGTLQSLVEAKTNSEFFRVVMEITPPPMP